MATTVATAMMAAMTVAVAVDAPRQTVVAQAAGKEVEWMSQLTSAANIEGKRSESAGMT